MNKTVSITIRESKEKDTEALRHLFFKSRVSTFYWVDTSQFSLSDFDEESKDECIVAAFAGETLVGFVSVWTADNFIHHLYVDEEYHNKGVGTLLLQAVINKYSLPVSLKCEEQNLRAIRFYEKKGFVEKERGQSKTGKYILFELNNEIRAAKNR